ncbi:MAG: hypothetical protein ACW98D_19155, partial [Promethearchaeota archaeon]
VLDENSCWKGRLCKKCKSIHDSNYYEKNKERIREQQKEYYSENKDDISVRRKIYRKENMDRVANIRKKYYSRHKDEIRLYNKKYYKNRKREEIKHKKKVCTNISRHMDEINSIESVINENGCATISKEQWYGTIRSLILCCKKCR